jgi:hypothetical protein
VYPAHDYQGNTVSSIGQEKRHNPRLQVDSRQAYIDQMDALELDPPRMMHIAVPANRACGLTPAARAELLGERPARLGQTMEPPPLRRSVSSTAP